MSFPNDTLTISCSLILSRSVKLQLPASIASHCRTTASSPTSAGGSRAGAVTGAGVACRRKMARIWWLRMGSD